MTDFCHISPTAFLDLFATGRSHHLTLAHLVEQDQDYADWYANQRGAAVNIMDNGAFECIKQNKPMYPTDKLITMGSKVKADYIVMSDYPGEHSSKTIEAAINTAPALKKAGFGTFFVPQSNVGDLDDLISCFKWAASAPNVDYIGVSILAIPNGYGVERNNKLQRFLSRWRFMNTLIEEGILSTILQNQKKIHFLGMVDGPNEIELCRDFLPYINTWDSSAAVWAGLNHIEFDRSPTGLVDGKFEKEVDFNFKIDDIGSSAEQLKAIGSALKNIRRIDNSLNKLARERENVLNSISNVFKDRG